MYQGPPNPPQSSQPAEFCENDNRIEDDEQRLRDDLARERDDEARVREDKERVEADKRRIEHDRRPSPRPVVSPPSYAPVGR
jgi:hypothetical protein